MMHCKSSRCYCLRSYNSAGRAEDETNLGLVFASCFCYNHCRRTHACVLRSLA